MVLNRELVRYKCKDLSVSNGTVQDEGHDVNIMDLRQKRMAQDQINQEVVPNPKPKPQP